jgi:hypothetical protein
MKYRGIGNNRYCNEKADTNLKPNKMMHHNNEMKTREMERNKYTRGRRERKKKM